MNFLSLPKKLFIYLKQTKTEVKKINWPTREQTIRYSLIVVTVSLVVALFLGGLDFLFSSILKSVIKLFS